MGMQFGDEGAQTSRRTRNAGCTRETRIFRAPQDVATICRLGGRSKTGLALDLAGKGIAWQRAPRRRLECRERVLTKGVLLVQRLD